MIRRLNPDKKLQAYIISLSLGDGNLSVVRKTTRLRITCDKKYPFLINTIKKSLESLLPDNKIYIVTTKRNAIDVSVYSNQLENLLGWKAAGGSKFIQNASVPHWIKKNRNYTICCLRGLIETDGSIYHDRGYKMVIFKNIILKLAKDFEDMVISLGFMPHFYKIDKNNMNSIFNQQDAYHVRLSKNVSEFLKIIQPQKR